MIRDNWEAIGETAQKLDNEVEARVRDTALFRTLTECLKEGKTERFLSPYVANLIIERLGALDDLPMYTRYSPSEIVNCISHSSFLKSRFHPEHSARVLRDLDKEAEILRRYVEKGKLEVWFKDILASVEASVATIHQKAQNKELGVQEPLSPTRSSDVKTRLNWL